MLTCKVGEKIIDTFSFKEEKIREWSNKSMLRCPVCGEKMIYCHGDYKIAYFRHEKSENCPDVYSEIVTQEHLMGIKILYEWLSNQKEIINLQLEKWIPETRQRPDIYFEIIEDGEVFKYAIELQCSPLATKYNERRDLYRLNNINDIWILGTLKYAFINLNIDKAVYNNNTIYDYKTKTIEREIFDSIGAINYLNVNNNQIYQVYEFKNSERTRYGYYSGKKYTVQLETTFNIRMNTNYLSNYSFEEALENNNISNNIECYKNIFEITKKCIIDWFTSNKSIDISDNLLDDNAIIGFKCNKKNFNVVYLTNIVDIKQLKNKFKEKNIIPIIFIDYLLKDNFRSQNNIYFININSEYVLNDNYSCSLEDLVFNGKELVSQKNIQSNFERMKYEFIRRNVSLSENIINEQSKMLLKVKKEVEMEKEIEDFKKQYESILNFNIKLIDGYYNVPDNIRFKYIRSFEDTKEYFINSLIPIISEFGKRKVSNINLMIERNFTHHKLVKRDLYNLYSLFTLYGFKNVSIYKEEEENI